MAHVYGDSSPFKYDVNFIELIRGGVECCVSLMAAQHNIAAAQQRGSNMEQTVRGERQRLEAMADAVRLTLTAFMSSNSERMVRTATRVLDTARGVIETELANVDAVASQEHANLRNGVEQAKGSSCRAIETFILSHEMPGTITELEILAGEETYSAQINMQTPFGVQATFAIAVPTAHAWFKVRRVIDVAGGTELKLPQESGWLQKRVQLQPTKLDKMFVSQVEISPESSTITLRRGQRSGPGYAIEVVHVDDPVVQVHVLAETGQRIGEPLKLSGEDREHARRLWKRVAETTRDLANHRQTMTQATFDDHPLNQLDEPQALCSRIVHLIAPEVLEIAKRSGAPGELVLRKDLGGGRREEIYITKAELHERVMVLPAQWRPVFDPLDLNEGPRSPRAPAPSGPIEIGSGEFDVEEELTKERLG